MRKIIILLAFLMTFFKLSKAEQPSFVIIIPSYNNAKWYGHNLRSVFKQEYPHYRVIYIDDHSTDYTASLVVSFVKRYNQSHRVTVIKNKKRVLKTENMYNAVHSCKNNEIVVVLDGDDWFAHSRVLNRIAQEYIENKVWATYGSYCDIHAMRYSLLKNLSRKHYKTAAIITQDTKAKINDPNRERFVRCVPAHPFSFYAGIYKLINVEDLKYQGEFISMATDAAFIMPLLEMCGERFSYIPNIQYIHNCVTEFNLHKIDAVLQGTIYTYIKNKKSYNRLPDASYWLNS